MTEAHAHVDKPEPRWQALLAMAAVGGVYLALPRELVIGPTWLLPTVIAVLLAPTIVTHRMGRHSFNHALGIVNNGIITVALIGSVSLLVAIWLSVNRDRFMRTSQPNPARKFYSPPVSSKGKLTPTSAVRKEIESR